MKINFLFIFLLAMFLSACKGNQNSQKTESEGDHEHEELKAKITSYTENYEVFAEADAFIVGRKSNVLTHFTHLNN